MVPERWSLYQKQHFAKVNLEDGSHEIPGWAVGNLMGENCGVEADADCTVGVNTWNYSFIYPTATYTADPGADGADATIEGKYVLIAYLGSNGMMSNRKCLTLGC